ncbi:MAG TPA: hypothetical protein VMU57_08800, partial [Edaphobacter sp.]|uniref:hypothetical protein n=1 Tax=Edaphobacter sp. TaxID=1934404 RepID=UPI002C8EB035
MTVTVSECYNVGCPQCCAEIERIVKAAIRDMSVSKLTLIPGHRHCHDEPAPPSATALEASGQQTLQGTLANHAAYADGE